MKPNQSQLRKAAIFIASLDDATADVLLDQMGEEQSALVRSELAALDDIDPEEQQQIIAEFRRAGIAPSSTPSTKQRGPRPESRSTNVVAQRAKSGVQVDDGIEVDISLAQQLADPEDARALGVSAPYSPYANHNSGPPFQFLHEADGHTLVTFLEREHPQTIALVVSHLSPTQAGEVLDALPTDLQVDVVRRLSELDDTDPDVLREVERGIQTWLAEQLRTRKRRAAGLASVSAILAATGKHSRDQIMSRLAKQDQALASRLEPDRYSDPQSVHDLSIGDRKGTLAMGNATRTVAPQSARFSQLMRASDKTIATVLAHAQPEIVVLALAGCDAKFVERAMRCVPAEQARLLRRALAHLGPTRLSDVEEAQEELAEIAADLSRGVTTETRQRASSPRVALAA